MTGTTSILLAFTITAIVVAWLLIGRYRRRRGTPPTVRHDARSSPVDNGPGIMADEEQSKIELEKVQQLIRDRKRLAWETDISHHLWSLYLNQFRSINSRSMDHHTPGEKWYEMKIRRSGSKDNPNRFDFELNGARYRFTDDEEKQGWCENIKHFSLSLHDGSGRCLIEIPMKVRVDRWGSTYSISSDAPAAFLPGDWVNDFVNATLKHQSIRNQEIRAQKHQERLWEIEDLKQRFGISD
jgi:hypothetical protein